MTPLPDDELVSAVLDGEATEAEVATVAADPALSARLEELRAVRAAVGAPVEPPTAAARDRAVAAALAATTADDVDVATPPPPAPAGIRRRPRWVVPAVAAAAVALVVGIAVVANRGGSNTSTTRAGGALTSAAGEDSSAPTTLASGAPTTAAAAQDSGGGGGAPSQGGATTTAGGATTTAAAGGAVAPTPESAPSALGPLDTPDAVRAKVAEVRSAVTAGPPATVIAACPAPDPGARLVGIAVWQGTPAYLFDVEGPPGRAILLATLDCHLLVEVPLT